MNIRKILLFGSLLGIIISLPFLGILFGNKPTMEDMENARLFTYSIMTVASLLGIVYGVFNIRKTTSPWGFSRAFAHGICIALIGAFIYGAVWASIIKFHPTFKADLLQMFRQMAAANMDGMDAEGMQMIERVYASWWLNLIFTMFIESVPVGLFFSLLAALLFRKK